MRHKHSRGWCLCVAKVARRKSFYSTNTRESRMLEYAIFPVLAMIVLLNEIWAHQAGCSAHRRGAKAPYSRAGDFAWKQERLPPDTHVPQHRFARGGPVVEWACAKLLDLTGNCAPLHGGCWAPLHWGSPSANAQRVAERRKRAAYPLRSPQARKQENSGSADSARPSPVQHAA